jgi:hypothetical protein
MTMVLVKKGKSEAGLYEPPLISLILSSQQTVFPTEERNLMAYLVSAPLIPCQRGKLLPLGGGWERAAFFCV